MSGVTEESCPSEQKQPKAVDSPKFHGKYRLPHQDFQVSPDCEVPGFMYDSKDPFTSENALGSSKEV
jgi:hypothetical protein